MSQILSKDLIKYVSKYSSQMKIDAGLVYAIINKESRFDEMAFRYEPKFFENYIKDMTPATLKKQCPSLKGYLFFNAATEKVLLSCSYGYMQIMGQTARGLGFDEPNLLKLLLPDNNIKFGCLCLAQKLNRYGDMEKAVSAYNAGSPTGRNKAYVAEVMKIYKEGFKP